jgi:putative endonuclease
MTAYVYILASKPRGTLYVGVTDDLVRRVYEHRTDAVEGLTKRYSVHRLVYFEVFDDIENAIAREKCIKRWNRSWKIQMIEEKNLYWEDLYELVCR